VTFTLVDAAADCVGWRQDEAIERTSHALAVDGRVWLVDPIDEPGLEERVRALGDPAGVLQLFDRHGRGCATWAARLGVPAVRAWEPADTAPFEVLTVGARRWWREVALWEPRSRTLVCADALGTAGLFLARGETIAVHPLLRPVPPRVLGSVQPERILVGHGAGIHQDATAALRHALANARRGLPNAWWHAFRGAWSSRA
jgi:hypothetical protein